MIMSRLLREATQSRPADWFDSAHKFCDSGNSGNIPSRYFAMTDSLNRAMAKDMRDVFELNKYKIGKIVTECICDNVGVHNDNHDGIFYLYCVAGDGILDVDGTGHFVKEGNGFLFDPNRQHRYISKKRSHFLVIALERNGVETTC